MKREFKSPAAARRSKRVRSVPTSDNSGHQRSSDEFSCISSGTAHQGDMGRFAGNNAQCVPMSTCACIYSCISDRDIFSTADIDTILNSGDLIYLRLRQPGIRYDSPHCYPDELLQLADGLQVGNHLAKISVDWKTNGLYPNSPNIDAELNNLELILRDEIFNADHSDATDSYLFTGLANTTSFWRHNNEYYYFNSHAVDEYNNNRYHPDWRGEGLARFFRCSSIKALAKLLFRLLPSEWYVSLPPQYSIDKITLISSEIKLPREPAVRLERLSASKLNEVIAKDHTLDPKFTTLKPVVILEKLPIAELSANDIAKFSSDLKLSYLKPTVVLAPVPLDTPTTNNEIIDGKPRGRPKKQKRGPCATIKNASCKAVQKYAKKNPQVNREAAKRYYQENRPHKIAAAIRYTQENPEINRDAVNRYSQQNPEVNREATARYNENSRNVDSILRELTTLIGQRCDDDLNPIATFSLSKTSLLSPDIYKCEYCNAPLFIEEKGREKWCCGGDGRYKIKDFAPLTEDFYSDPSFLQRSRAYNHLFAFSALGTTHGFQNPESGISFVKVQGRIYHRVFDLSYSESTNPIGLYIDDSSERERIATGQSLNRDIVRSITHFLHEHNPYINCFKRLSQETSEQAHLIFDTRASRPRDGNILGDRPVGNEVAAIISTETERYIPRCIVIWKIGGSKPHTVDLMHKLYESLQYPLLYPNGETGWEINTKDNNGCKLNQHKYVRWLLLSQPRFSQLGRLSEEWLVDMWCRVLEERLRYLTRQQTPRNQSGGLRVAPLEELLNDETIQGEGGVVPGRIYLPYTFTGCDRYMKHHYLDAISILNRLGAPSFFLTMTCNPKWPEIQQSTPAGLNPSPMVCARVFNLKLAQLLRDLKSKAYFGGIVYILHVIEFQKRGLPHAHIAFRVEGGGPVQNVDIDSFIRADIPSPTEANGRLRAAVLKHMIHGPCGPNYRTDLQCWDNELNKCTRYFPKKETAVTYCDDRGFTHLRRDSKNEATIKYRNRDVVVNDLWVAPYNAALLLKYDCHINLEATSARSMIKYLFKYITKGVDAARVALVPDELRNNEIETYVTKRYIGSCDAAWRVFEFHIVGRDPTVIQLPVHLKDRQSVFFRPDNVAEAAERSGSLLLTYFVRPPGEEFDRLTYIEFCEKYIVHPSRPNMKSADIQIYELSNGKFVTPRQRGRIVARMFWVAPNRGEQFYLRLLLSAYPCRSYDDLISLGGADCTTFQGAAQAVGLADDESEYHRAMQEASTFMTASRLRHFFVMLAANGIAVASLWEGFKDQLSEDFIKRLGSDLVDRAREESLVVINRLLRKHGSSLREQGLPEVHDDTTELGREYVEYDRELLNGFVQEWLPKLSVDQRAVYDYVHEFVTNTEFRAQNNNAIFVDGPAGTGKTLLLNLITSHVRGELKGVVLCTASSGIAAQNYPNGMTAHSMFKLPIDLVDDLGHWSVTRRSQRGELISNADVIIYDEAPMAHKYLIHMLERSLRDLMDSDKLFGGKLIIFAGDFRQIPPVVVNAKTGSDVINCSVKSSPVWEKLKTFSLTTSQRQTNDPEFGEFLLRLGSNQLPSVRVKVGRNFQNLIDLSDISYVTSLSDLIDFVFPLADLAEPDTCASRAILSTHNAGVKEINNEMMRRLPNEEMHFFSVDNVVSEGSDELYFGTDALNRLQPNGVPEYDLVLKVGCVCMVTRNLSFADGLVNGTKVIVVAATPRLITVRKPNQQEDYLIPRISFKAPIDRRSPIEMMRRQFPLQVCYAMSIHKSQGQTISRVGVDLRSDVFSHGQLYVALGRVQNRNDIKILTHRSRVFNNRSMANNVVYPQLL